LKSASCVADLQGERLRLLHLLEDHVLAGLDVPLDPLDLVEDGGVLLVGLDLHELALVLRALRLQVLDRGLVLLAGLLRGLERRPGGVEVGPVPGEALVDLLAEAGNLAELGLDALEVGFGVVEADELLEVGVHGREEGDGGTLGSHSTPGGGPGGDVGLEGLEPSTSRL
jgi:hypothetical protein